MESSSSDDDAIIPGVNKMGPGNLRPKLRPRRPRDVVRTKAASRQSAVEEIPSTTTLSVQDLSQSLDERRLRPAGGGKRGAVSLKDLCVEDKRRIANLIKELAKVGEEREKAREELDKERRDYEQQILKLVEQQEQILKERQEVEKHLQECQLLLARSQQFQLPQPSTVAPPALSSHPHTHPHPQWLPATAAAAVHGVGGQDAGHSMLANVGSPHTHFHLPADGLNATERGVALYRYQQQQQISPAVAAQPSHSHPHHNAPVSTPSNYANTQRPANPETVHHGQDQTHHPQPPTNFFASALQQPELVDIFSPQKARGGNAMIDPSYASKEEIINRFFASQPAENGGAILSPKRRDAHKARTKQSGKGSKQGVFLPPIMSSTQKSAEIGDYLSVDSHQEFAPLVPDKSSAGGSESGESDDDRDNVRRQDGRRIATNRVMFAEGGDNEWTGHSPLGDNGDSENTAQVYHKMSQAQRKEQLLQQRLALLEEQQRLKHILKEQEAMLQEKQQALKVRSHRHDNAAVDANDAGGNNLEDDPLGLVPQRLAIDAALERQRAIVDSLELEAEHRDSATKSNNSSASNRATASQPRPDRRAETGKERQGSGEKTRGDRRENGDTYVVHSDKLSDVVRKLDYSLHSDSDETAEERRGSNGDDISEKEEDDGDDYEEAEKQTPTAHTQDVGTSVSYHTISRPYPSPAEGGIAKQLHPRQTDGGFSSSHPPLVHKPHTPGEKTMSVLEIINSLHSPRARLDFPPSKPSAHQQFSPFQQELPPSSGDYKELLPQQRWREEEDEDADEVDSSGDDDIENEEENQSVNKDDLEESQILEDIFFLK